MFQTEYEFTLPKGFLESDGTLHRDGIMRLATAADEILPLQDPRVAKNPAYLLIILLSRVVVKLGGIKQITPETIGSCSPATSTTCRRSITASTATRPSACRSNARGAAKSSR